LTKASKCQVNSTSGLKTFVEVGQALMLIRDKRLYRAEFGTFKNYCEEKWGFKESRVYQLIQSSEVVGNLENSTKVEFSPQSETHIRPLTKLEPELQAEAWQKTVEQHGENITQKKVEEVVKEFVPIRLRRMSYRIKCFSVKLCSRSISSFVLSIFEYLNSIAKTWSSASAFVLSSKFNDS
jgi:hypothetical protein